MPTLYPDEDIGRYVHCVLIKFAEPDPCSNMAWSHQTLSFPIIVASWVTIVVVIQDMRHTASTSWRCRAIMLEYAPARGPVPLEVVELLEGVAVRECRT